MRRPVEEMTERELLEELVQEKRLQETLRRVRLGVYAVLAVAAGIGVVSAIAAMALRHRIDDR